MAIMKQINNANSKLSERNSKKRIFGLVSKEIHTRAKITAYSQNMKLEEWVEMAIKEKLDRDGSVIPFNRTS
jgi:predicted HicB family RNase H-like nuclease